MRKSLAIIGNLRVFLMHRVCCNCLHFNRMPPSNLIWQASYNALQKPIPHCTHADRMSDSISNISAQSTLHYRHVKRTRSRTLHKETGAHKLLYSWLSLFSTCLCIYNAEWQIFWRFPFVLDLLLKFLGNLAFYSCNAELKNNVHRSFGFSRILEETRVIFFGETYKRKKSRHLILLLSWRNNFWDRNW